MQSPKSTEETVKKAVLAIWHAIKCEFGWHDTSKDCYGTYCLKCPWAHYDW